MPDRDLRLFGIYPQAETDRYFLRCKIPAGILDSDRAEGLADLADEMGEGVVHLTTRMSIEIHGLGGEDLEAALDRLTSIGLTSRGACGGAVRGVALSTPDHPEHGRVSALAERIQNHFTGRAEFEGLPKKFKIGVDTDYRGSRCFIQDAGLVSDGQGGYDVWLAGGLGRQPTPAFKYRSRVAEAEILPLLEATVRVYAAHGAKGKRLKHLVAELGRDAFVQLLEKEWDPKTAVSPVPADTPASVLPVRLLRVAVFAGQLSCDRLRALAGVARRHGNAGLVLLPSQDLALATGDKQTTLALMPALAELADEENDTAEGMAICPGSHQCKLGLAPTREVARRLLDTMGSRARGGSWAISGCPNSCAQPQLADFGVICTRRTKGDDGERTPRYDLLQQQGGGFGIPIASDLTLNQLVAAVEAIG